MHDTSHFEGFAEAKLKKSLKRKKFARFIFLVKNEVGTNTFLATKQHTINVSSSLFVVVSLPSSFYANVLHDVLQLSTHIIELYFIITWM